eukprot:CAMPEP_0206361218 /NCGR_PEP_ID=MMETSP0294-20121207/212_1 /ASSEMBLY_ACC=CAM_ASM_000327 /TAXON_ID=39354 /ORGANISM="Heterosigma akashiwo, Strain CCMP2393" /LENGTH=74 /DNA_ID=CAMNT_0053806023 /DNA_START=37 /DNA_END=257 /DNA_ORIENTATION=+
MYNESFSASLLGGHSKQSFAEPGTLQPLQQLFPPFFQPADPHQPPNGEEPLPDCAPAGPAPGLARRQKKHVVAR